MPRWHTLLTALALFLGACDVPEQSRRGNLDNASEAPGTIAVQVLVLTRADGTGNALWTLDYATQVLRAAQSYLGSTTRFGLARLTTVPDDRLYALHQLELLYEACGQQGLFAPEGLLTVVISQPRSAESNGLSFQADPSHWFAAPCFVMQDKSGDTTPPAIFDTARYVFLHELGHQLGLAHQEVAAAQGRLVHTDNYWESTTGQQLVRDFAAFLAVD